MGLAQMGITNIIELIDSPPLVSRVNPHNLPFFDNVFDFVFSDYMAEALFLSRFVSEIERTGRPDGVCIIVVEECEDKEVGEIVGLFQNLRLVNVVNVTLIGLRRTRIVMRTQKISS